MPRPDGPCSYQKGLGSGVYTNYIGCRSGVLSEFWASFDGVSGLTCPLYNLYLSGLEGLEGSGFRV